MSIMDVAETYLSDRAVSVPAAAHTHLSVTDNAREINPTFHPRPALVIPYPTPEGALNGFVRVRYFDPPEVGGLQKRAIRYQQPKGTAPEAYLPHVAGHSWPATINNPQQPVIITEGEIKALSVMVNAQIPTLGLGGVWMWADHKQPLPILEAFAWERRHVFIVFDSDVDTKPGVQLAESRLAQYLLRRRAVVHTARLPPSADGGKQGADDFIAAHGAAAFTRALTETRSMTEMDLRVLELNEEIAYLDAEEKIIEVKTGTLLRKDSLTSGSRHSTLKVPVPAAKGVKMVSVAQSWLTHPMARRYADTIFRPGGRPVISEGGNTYLNVWFEQPCEEGDVSLFLSHTRLIFETDMGDDWDFPIKLLAYKAQHQTEKIPIAIMLIGGQGGGKSLWAALARSAFGAFGASKNGKDIAQDWNGFLEKALLVTIDDVSVRQMRGNIETVRNWITEPRITRIEKYLKNREIDNYAFLIFTGNPKDAAAFDHDDRRFLVIGTPKRELGAEYFGPIQAWLRSGNAGPAIYHYLLNYDLDGWTPPIEAPMTAEKRMAYEESLSEFERLARDMKDSGEHVVVQWLQAAEEWAYSVIGSPGHTDTARANEILAALAAFPIRPWYTAAELCNMFPHMLRDLDATMRRYSKAALPGKVSTALRNAGIEFLKNTDHTDGFMWRGRRAQFLIVCPGAGFPKAMSQAEFDERMAQMGTYQPRRRA